MNVEAIHRVDSQRENFLSIALYAAARRAEDGHIHIAEVTDILHYSITFQFFWQVICPTATYDTSQLKVGCFQQCLQCKAAYIAIAYYGCSNCLHNEMYF